MILNFLKEIRIKLLYTILFSLILLTAIYCSKDSSIDLNNPFDSCFPKGEIQRNKIVVISDIHLGPDLSYSEWNSHLPRLSQFLTEIKNSKTVKELVIAGDLLDERQLRFLLSN